MNQWMVFIESKIFDLFGISSNLIWLWGREKREKTKANFLHKIIDIRRRTNTKFFSSSMIFISTNSEKICSIFSIIEWKVEDGESSSFAPFPSSINRIFLFTLLQSLKKLICSQILEKMLQENWTNDNFVDHRVKVMREVRRKREKNSLFFIRLNYLKQWKTKNPFEVKHLKKRGRSDDFDCFNFSSRYSFLSKLISVFE